MFDDEQKTCQTFSSKALKLMFGVQKKYILFMCMVGIQMSMPKSQTVTNHRHLLLLSSVTFKVYVGCVAMKSVIHLPFALPPIPSHIPPICFLLFFIVTLFIPCCSLPHLVICWQQCSIDKNIYNPKFILNFIAWTLLYEKWVNINFSVTQKSVVRVNVKGKVVS